MTVCAATPPGELSSALIANPQAAESIYEVFAHPFTAGETICQSTLGVLKVNDRPARAEVVEQVGNGDYLLRITLA